MANFFKRLFSSSKGKETIDPKYGREYNSAKGSQRLEALQDYIEGLEFYKEDNYEEALIRFNDAIQKGLVNDSAAYQYRGTCFQKFDRHPAAIKDFTKSILIDPNDWEAYYFRANSYEELDDLHNQYSDTKKFKGILESKKKLSENEEDALRKTEYELKRIDIYIDLQDKKRAIEEQYEDFIQEARKKNENNIQQVVIPRKIYVPTYERAIEKGLHFDKDNKKNLALEYYDYAIEKNITDKRAFSLRGFCLQSLGFDLDAIDDFTKAIALDPDDCNLYFGRGNSYFSIKDYAAAIENGKQAVHYAKLNERFFEGYTAQAKAMGFESAQGLYESFLNIWGNSNDSDFEKSIESLHNKMLQSGEESAFVYVENYQNKKQLQNRELFKRRPK